MLELTLERVPYRAELAIEAANVPHGLRQFFGTEHDEGEQGDDDQLAALQVEHAAESMGLAGSGAVQQRLPSLLDPPILFAHRGARAHAAENTLDAFSLALRLGATGIESDVWVTRDGVAVLDHDGVVRRGLRRPRIAELERQDLPAHIPTLVELLDLVDPLFPISLDLKDQAALDPVLRAIEGRNPERLWLCHPAADTVEAIQRSGVALRTVHSTRVDRMPGGPERWMATLANLGVAAVNLRHDDWNGGLVTLAHRFELLAFGWDLQHAHVLETGLRMGLDAVYSDHVDLMVEVAEREVGGPP